jgi:hypothetical protein
MFELPLLQIAYLNESFRLAACARYNQASETAARAPLKSSGGRLKEL